MRKRSVARNAKKKPTQAAVAGVYDPGRTFGAGLEEASYNITL